MFNRYNQYIASLSKKKQQLVHQYTIETAGFKDKKNEKFKILQDIIKNAPKISDKIICFHAVSHQYSWNAIVPGMTVEIPAITSTTLAKEKDFLGGFVERFVLDLKFKDDKEYLNDEFDNSLFFWIYNEIINEHQFTKIRKNVRLLKNYLTTVLESELEEMSMEEVLIYIQENYLSQFFRIFNNIKQSFVQIRALTTDMCCLLKIVPKQGLYIGDWSRYPEQKEFLLPSDCAYTVKKISYEYFNFDTDPFDRYRHAQLYPHPTTKMSQVVSKKIVRNFVKVKVKVIELLMK